MAQKEKETVKLPTEIEALRAENIELKSEVARLSEILKKTYSVTVRGWYNGHKPNSVITVSEEEYASMRKSGVIY